MSLYTGNNDDIYKECMESINNAVSTPLLVVLILSFFSFNHCVCL